jgi:hypothetical protein
MRRKSVKSALVIAFSMIVVSGALTLSNSDNSYVMALKKYHKTIADSQQPFSSYSNSSNNEFYKVVDGQRNRCHNDYGLNAVVCVKDTETSSPLEQTAAPQNTSSSRDRIPIVNQSVPTENSNTTANTTAPTQNENSLQAVGPAFTNDSPNADTSGIFSTPMTSDSLSSFLDSKKSSSEIP